MNIIAVDDEPLALKSIARVISSEIQGAQLSLFDSPQGVLEFAGSNRIDVAFLDIEMSGMNGLQLAKQLKDIYGKTNIIFVTGYSEYALEAYNLQPTGYLMKPVTAQCLRDAMDNLRHPIDPVPKKRLNVRTFGNFEVFSDGKPLFFSRTKTKELFAYLVSREGAMCSNNEIIAAIWEEKENSESLKSQFRHLVADLTKTLDDADASNVLVKRRGLLAVAPDEFYCDLYEVKKGDVNALNRYMGEFMVQYSWAEFNNAYLDRMK